ncbi:MAG: DUF4381 family protein [Akkermansiaceae bacterium]|jgi:hypothetical protein|nr:DUF4381 family protein [Akkermansiaceae bacterium]
MPEPTTRLEFAAPPSPEALLPTYGLWPWWVAAGVLVLLAIVVMIRRRRKKTVYDPVAARNAAFHEALAAMKEARAENPREAAVKSSLILRRYLSAAAADPALFETHEEFISRHDALQALTPDARTATETGFSRLASLKYAPEIPEADPDAVLNDSTALLQTIHLGFAA